MQKFPLLLLVDFCDFHKTENPLAAKVGASFSSHYLARACAKLGIGIFHSKPYESPFREKIKRFFRTVREGFLIEVKETINLDRDDYLKYVHLGNKSKVIGPLDEINNQLSQQDLDDSEIFI